MLEKITTKLKESAKTDSVWAGIITLAEMSSYDTLYPAVGTTPCPPRVQDDGSADKTTCEGQVVWRSAGDDMEFGYCDICGYEVSRHPTSSMSGIAGVNALAIRRAHKAGMPKRLIDECSIEGGISHSHRKAIEISYGFSAISGQPRADRLRIAAWRLWQTCLDGYPALWVHADEIGRSYKREQQKSYLMTSLLVIHSLLRSELDSKGHIRPALLSVIRDRTLDRKTTIVCTGMAKHELEIAMGPTKDDDWQIWHQRIMDITGGAILSKPGRDSSDSV